MTKLKNLQHEAHKINLSHNEKAVMRAQIFGEASAPTPSYVVSHFHFFSVRLMPAMAAVLIVLLGGGTAYAAQAALPGDLLYTVKVGVNEPVRQALAVSTEAKVAFHTDVAETRLEEAEALAVQGRLNAVISEQIEASLDTHLAHAEAITTELKEEDADESEEILAELESVLSAHSSILASLGEESDDEETKERSSRLATRISSRSSARALAVVDSAATMSLKVAAPEGGFATETAISLEVGGAGDASDMEMTMQATQTPPTSTPEASEAQKRAAEQLRVKSKQYLANAEEEFAELVEELEGGLDSDTSKRVESQFETLISMHAEGEALLESHDYAAARATFSSVMSDSAAFAAYLRAEKRFNRNHLRSWVDNRFGRVFGAEIEIEFENDKGSKSNNDHEDEEDEQDQEDSGSRDGEDGRDGKDGKDGEDGKPGASGDVKINLGL